MKQHQPVHNAIERWQTPKKALKQIIKGLLVVFLISLSPLCKAQEKKPGKSAHKNKSVPAYFLERSGRDFYNIKDTLLINELSKLKYDSVKVFYFNRNRNQTQKFSLKVDTPNIYNVRITDDNPVEINGSNTTDKGKLLQKRDGQQLLQTLKNSYKDIYGNDPVSPFSPTVGFVFFKNGIVYAHIDIALRYGKIELEIFNKKESPFRYYWEVIGDETERVLNLLYKKYQVPYWAFDE
ncbi:hypothetical protein BH09BAC6_BH09BAC6_05170 [soil metagenome]